MKCERGWVCESKGELLVSSMGGKDQNTLYTYLKFSKNKKY